MSRPASALTSCHEIIRVRGLVQGVGFRPTVWRIALELNMAGHVLNDGEGVLIDGWADKTVMDEFVTRLYQQRPPLARIDKIERKSVHSNDAAPSSFSIAASAGHGAHTAVAADATTCKACTRESLDPFNRRYRYPFTNCTNCGPRLSIIRGIPYDRDQTSMSKFIQCDQCQSEYEDPSNRRFHAQPNACYVCGPKAQLVRTDGRVICTENLTQLDDVDAACSLLQKGEIVAIKGIGGFHLACDASNKDVVALLRLRKNRPAKPFALMAADCEIVKQHCYLNSTEQKLLESAVAPIVLLSQLDESDLAANVAPGQNTLGMMLPYTPLHHLLLRRLRRPIVLTSGNVSDEPQCIDNTDAMQRLLKICDYALLHNRDIVNRVDDSVVRVSCGKTQVMRRSRGYAPAPISLPPGFEQSPSSLAMGADLKNTFCLLQHGSAVVSQHIGDLHNAATFADYEKNIRLFGTLFQHAPTRIVVDYHPEYMSGKLGINRARSERLELSKVQHHHAHIASCLADNNRPLNADKVLGVALDGLGLSEHGEFWGGEFMVCDYTDYERVATFKPVALPGNNQAMRQPWRNTYAHIVGQMGWAAFKMNFCELELCRYLESKPLQALDAMLKTNTNAPLASSCGRLFDAVAAAMGICAEQVSYEGQAAMELEALVDLRCLHDEDDRLAYPFTLPKLKSNGLPYIEPLAMWNALLGDLILNTPVPVMAARFHKGLAKAIVHTVRVVTRNTSEHEINTVALSGGVFQNKILLEQVVQRLDKENYEVLIHARFPANDGGISLGQSLIDAARVLNKRRID